MLKQLIDLLVQIATQKRPVQVEVNYDGRNFRWQIKVSNVSAEEFSGIGIAGRQVKGSDSVGEA